MTKSPGAVLVPLLLVALTAGVGVWDLEATRPVPVRAVGQAAPDVPPIVPVLRRRASAQEFQAGVSVVVYGNDPYFERKAQVLLNRLADTGANSVSLVIPIFQDGPVAPAVYTDPKLTPIDGRIATFAIEARRRGFSVMLRPLLDILIYPSPADWRGAIRPPNLAQWQQSYMDVTLAYARVAQLDHVDMFDIGSELDSMERDSGYWLRLIAAVRGVYSGQLTYSSNWAKSFPAFGRRLDFIGVDAYYPLAAPGDAPVARLAAAWNPWLARLAAMRRAFNKPLVLTELGTTSQVGSYQRPWVPDNGQPIDLSAQRRYYQAACQAVIPRVAGAYWWLYTLDPPAQPSSDASFMVAGKPAEADLGECFRGSQPPVRSVLGRR